MAVVRAACTATAASMALSTSASRASVPRAADRVKTGRSGHPAYGKLFLIAEPHGYLSGTAPGPAAVGTWAALVGGLILTRMTNDSELSDEILNETRAWLAAQNRKKTKTRRG
jgi:hypothetical protein